MTKYYRNLESWLALKKRKRAGERIPSYRRTGTNITYSLEKQLCNLECGYSCRLFPSGMAALTFSILTCAKSNSHVIFFSPSFSRFSVLKKTLYEQWGICISHSPYQLDYAISQIKSNTCAIILENPSYLTMEVIELDVLARKCRDVGIAMIVDNTWSSGIQSHPIVHGADMSIIACSKYIGGTIGALGGVVISGKRYSNALNDLHYSLGQTISDDDALKIIFGLHTIENRLHIHGENCQQIVSQICKLSDAYDVVHPSTLEGKHKNIFNTYISGTNGLFTMVFQNDGLDRKIRSLVNNLKIFQIGQSWGHDTSSVNYIRNHHNANKIFLRFSVGLEEKEELVNDVIQAINKSGIG